MPFNQIPSDDIINKTVEALKANGIDAIVVANQAEAKQKALELIPQGSEIMTVTPAVALAPNSMSPGISILSVKSSRPWIRKRRSWR